MSNNIVIFCRNLADEATPFSSDYYFNAYLDLYLTIKSKGYQIYFATDPTTYLGDGLFSVAYSTDSKLPPSQFTKHHDIKASVILDKGHFTPTDNVRLVNPEYVNTITADKSLTYELFGELQPLSVVCHDRTEYDQALATCKTDIVAVKKPISNGGKHVVIKPKSELTTPTMSFPVIIQEFIDTSGGIPGIVDGLHDLRVMIAGGKVIGGRVRIPAPGELRANIAQGGSEFMLDPSEIPDEILKLAESIDQKFIDYDRYYAIDFGNTPIGWKLIELNTRPGLIPISLGKKAASINDALADYLISIAG